MYNFVLYIHLDLCVIWVCWSGGGCGCSRGGGGGGWAVGGLFVGVDACRFALCVGGLVVVAVVVDGRVMGVGGGG